MIPVSLKLDGFLSYSRPTEVDFTPFEVVCLTGGNGEGKSSILDGLCYALFGAARGCEGGQNTERLINEGADRMSVEFTFALGDATYRISRSRTKTGRADLQLLVRDGDGWTNLAADSLRETEARIGSILRMDYRTFVASAFLLQGRADDFLTRMKPEDRKDVFARLLDLGAYERLEEAARGYARDAETQRKALAERVEQLGQEVGALAALEEELRGAESAAEAAAKTVGSAEEELEARRAELARLERTLALVEREKQSLAELRERLETDRAALDGAGRELAGIDSLLARRDEVRAALDEAARLTMEDEALREAASRAAALETRRAGLLGVMDAERASIQSRRRQRQAELQGLGKEIAELNKLVPRLEELDALLEESAQVETSIDEVRRQITTLSEEHSSIQAEIRGLEQRAEELERKLQLVGAQGAECPLCRAELDATHRRRIVKELKDDIASGGREQKRLASRREEVVKEGKRLREEERRLKEVLSQRQKLASSTAGLRARIERMPALSERRELLLAGDRVDEELLGSEAFAADARAELAAVEAESAGVAYDAEHHSHVRSRLGELAPYGTLEGRLEEAAARRPRVEGERERLASRLVSDETALAERARVLDELAPALEAEAAVRRRVGESQTILAQARAGAAAASAQTARVRERVDALSRMAADLAQARGAEQSAADRRRRYQRLAQAFGRGGIPDLIIDNVRPELEADANEILAQLTDCEMSLQFRMEKKTKAGKAKETFDVLVYHDGGVRDYQMFSGGEAYRVAFAIRLGLSKLLVRRAGARLETLVIDEGFGTQDAQGRERLVEAVNLARTHFAKIVVITHLDELKDAFGGQIRVTKDAAGGSSLQVVAA